MVIVSSRSLLENLFHVAVAAAQPGLAMRSYLPSPPAGKTVVVGAGKAASQMASALERMWPGELGGVVVAKHGPVEECRRITVLRAAHPVPDKAGLAASRALLNAVAGLTEHDLVIALISGGGSSLLPYPAGNLSLADEIAVTQVLLSSGAPISAMNVIRNHVSRIKGGQLASAAFPAKIVTLVVSDVPGDEPGLVASGPTIQNFSTPQDALRVAEQFGIKLPAAVIRHLEATAQVARETTAINAETHVIVSARASLDAAAAAARAGGCEAIILSDAIEGEAREIGKMHAALAIESARRRKTDRPLVILSGGETSVTMPEQCAGRGGRNTEFLLSLAIAIEGQQGIHALAADTDGFDGSENNAGAFADGRTVTQLRERGLDARTLQNRHDAYTAFAATDSLFFTGPTGTNVNDFRAMVVF